MYLGRESTRNVLLRYRKSGLWFLWASEAFFDSLLSDKETLGQGNAEYSQYSAIHLQLLSTLIQFCIVLFTDNVGESPATFSTFNLVSRLKGTDSALVN